jgi:excisionase family DNA binding protein
MPVEREAFSIREFSRLHGLSVSFVYQLISEGRGPATIKIGSRRLVTREAAEAWRKSLVAESRAA